MGTTMECKLCHKKKPLRKSHIIPEFFYRPGYDEKGRLFVVREGISEDRYIQKGIREYLLCSECEHFLNDNYEKYFYEFWYKKKNILKETVGKIYKVIGLDYAKAKLFLLSILWRASVASGKDYNQVMLGPHESIIRDMILSKDPKDPSNYQIFATLLLLPDSNTICGEFIMSPIVCRYDARHLYVFTFGGCIWNFVVSSHPIGYPVDVCSLSDKGTITMPTMILTDFPPVKKFISAQIGRFGASGLKK
jgi:hypothetical protein